MYGVDERGNLLGHLDREFTSDTWKGRLGESHITAFNRAAAEMALKEHVKAVKVVVTEEPLHLMGVIIAI